LSSTKSDLKCIFIGSTRDIILKELDSKSKLLADLFLETPGSLTEEQIAKIYLSPSIALSYFVDGISSRRGSALTSLQFGVPLLTTKTSETPSVFKNLPFIKLVEVNSFKSHFQESLKEFLSFSESQINQREIRSYFMKNFSWDVIVETYLSESNIL
jgi:glycosyltransferase involved in cell wall biosynthesis